MSKKIRPITLEMDKELWDNFKSKTTKDVTLNNKIISLIEGYVENES